MMLVFVKIGILLTLSLHVLADHERKSHHVLLTKGCVPLRSCVDKVHKLLVVVENESLF